MLILSADLARLVTALEARAKKAEEALAASDARAKVAAAAAAKLLSAAQAGSDARVSSCEADLKDRVKLYEEALKKCQGSAWYKSPTLWAIIGSAAGAGVCGLAVGLSR